MRLCDLNVRVNASNLPEAKVADELRGVSKRDCGRAAKLRAAVDEIVAGHL